MSKKMSREQSVGESKRNSPSRKSKKTSLTHVERSKISNEKLSQALYHHEIKSKSNKIVLYDEFQSEKQDIDGAVTSRYLPMETDGESLRRCQKIENLQQRQQTPSKKRREEGEKKLRDTRTKRKENKNQLHYRMMNYEQSLILTPLVSVRDC